VPDLSFAEMIPAVEVFPKNTGGFVTTDAANMIANPDIIDIILAQVRKVKTAALFLCVCVRR
jgi:hypothetical protein